MSIRPYLMLTASLVLAACSSSAPDHDKRWYTTEQLSLGKGVFATHCARCHGDKAQGSGVNWRKQQSDGHYPPPPLNGSAHAWHHPMSYLLNTLAEGGAPGGGVMPAFKQQLSEEERKAAIAWFQHFWPDTVYQSWKAR